jgi:hypothetical protein
VGSLGRLMLARFPAPMHRNRLDLHEDFRRGETSDLDQRGAGKITSEKAPYFGVLFDVDEVDGHFHEIRRRSAGRLDEMTDFPEDDFRLFVFRCSRRCRRSSKT